MLNKVASSTIFCVFGMNRLGIEPLSPGPVNTEHNEKQDKV